MLPFLSWIILSFVWSVYAGFLVQYKCANLRKQNGLWLFRELAFWFPLRNVFLPLSDAGSDEETTIIMLWKVNNSLLPWTFLKNQQSLVFWDNTMFLFQTLFWFWLMTYVSDKVIFLIRLLLGCFCSFVLILGKLSFLQLKSLIHYLL